MLLVIVCSPHDHVHANRFRLEITVIGFEISNGRTYICNNVEKIRLTAFKQYRHLAAAFLLALYAFVAMPTQLWHHHALPVAGKACTTERTELKGAKVNADIFTDDCLICSHKYSVYNDTVFIPELTFLFSFPERSDIGKVSIPVSLSFGLPNKGPPRLS